MTEYRTTMTAAVFFGLCKRLMHPVWLVPDIQNLLRISNLYMDALQVLGILYTRHL